MPPYLFTRCFSPNSVGDFTSGKGPVGPKLEGDALLEEFQKHKSLTNKEHTALISVSSRIIDTLSRALSKWCGNEEAGDIWIAFIDIPKPDTVPYHHAQELVEDEESYLYKYEYLFEWEIPQKYILHAVSLQALIDNGFDISSYIHENGEAPSTNTLKDWVAEDYFVDRTDHYEVGLDLGLMVRCFGAEAPVLEIAKQFIYDCTLVIDWDNERQYAGIRFGSRKEGEGLNITVLEFEDLRLWDDGIHTALFEWWLWGPDFCQERLYQEVREREEWAEDMENRIYQDYMFFYGDY